MDTLDAPPAPPAASQGWLRRIVFGRNPRRTFIRIVIIVVAVFLVRDFVLLPIRVRGISMYPTYREGSINLINRLAYLHSRPQRGDVVALRLTAGNTLVPSFAYLKRVVGLPGETVEFQNGKLLVNGQPIDEPYLNPAGCEWNLPPETLEPDTYYVVGDNRAMPEERHEKGKAPFNLILGRVIPCKKSHDS
ncbi:MAG: signal peptidase I [Verrucomicrobiota bacterium]